MFLILITGARAMRLRPVKVFLNKALEYLAPIASSEDAILKT
jgi:hypothetical protein